MRKKYLPIGSYSSGAILVEDIAPELLWTLGQINKKKAAKWTAEFNRMRRHNPEEDHEFLSDLTEAMGQYCRPYTYVGSNEGNGADVGCWISYDSLGDDARYGESILKIDAGETWPKKLKVEYVLETSDHGNMALYNYKTRKEIWSIV